MTACPFCGRDNIEGADMCEGCEQPLTEVHIQEPATNVERGLVNDAILALEPKSPVVVAPATPVIEVLRLMVERRIGCVIVVEREAIVGIFSERDALRRIGPDIASVGEHPVSEFMTPGIESLEEDAKVAFAVHRMDLGGYRHIPIVDKRGKPTGVVSVRDVLRYLAEHMT